MPGFDGHATIQALQEIRPHVTVIAMSGGLAKEPKGQLRNHGKHVSFLQKPFSGDALLNALHEVLKG